MRKALVLGPLAIFLAFVAAALFGLNRGEDRTVRSALVGQPVPGFDLPGLDAAHPGLATSDVRQGGVVLVNLFASWCLPCKVEAPQLKALADRGVIIHGIAVADKPQDVAAFLEQNGNPYRRIGLDPDRRVAIALGSSGVPETYLVDGQGIIRMQHIGDIRAEHVPEILKAVAEAKR